jgi:transposase
VKPFVKSNKNDFLDAEAIAEAVGRQNMRIVPIKTDDQLDLQAIHRVRDRLIACRTAVINQLRAFLLERGMTFAKSPAKLKLAMPEILENADSNLTSRMRNLVADLWTEWKSLELQIEASNQEIEQIATSDAACTRLRSIPGIGPLIATAIVAAIGNGAAFRKGREFAAFVGLVPRQYSTGGKAHLLGISKRGNSYLRKLLNPWSACGSRAHEARTCTLRWLAQRTGKEGASQRGCHRHRQQAGSDRLGGPVQWRSVQAGSCYRRGLTTVNVNRKKPNLTHRGLHRKSETSQQSQRRACNLLPTMVPQGRSAYKNRHARISSWPGEETLQLKAGYIDADCFLRPSALPLQSSGGPYIVGN